MRALKNRFLKPLIGLSFLKFGLSGWKVGLKPTWATLAVTPANRHMPAIGATVVSISVSPSCISECSPAAVVAAPGWEISAKIVRIELLTPSTTFGPMNSSPASPAASTTALFVSVLLATFP